MYIFVLSEQKDTFNEFILDIDSLLVKKHYNNLTLYSFHALSLTYATTQLSTPGDYYVLIDTLSYPDIQTTLTDLQIHIKSLIAGVLAVTDQYASALLNVTSPVYGYINFLKNNYQHELDTVLYCLNERCQSMRSKLYVNYNGYTHFIDYMDIYFIETDKGTHNCTIYHACGTFPVRATIKSLITKLDHRFLIVRSSTIANLAAVRRIDYTNRVMYFTDQLTCTYAQNFYQHIRKRMSELYQAANNC